MNPPAGETLAVDTSVAVPIFVATHPFHSVIMRWRAGRRLVLGGHAAVETYSVITRLPGDLGVSAPEAVHLMRTEFGESIQLPVDVAHRIPELLAAAGIFGGAVYDGMVALAALHHDLPLATRDLRARATYAALGVRVLTVT